MDLYSNILLRLGSWFAEITLINEPSTTCQRYWRLIKKMVQLFWITDIRLEKSMGAPAPMAPMLPTPLYMIIM